MSKSVLTGISGTNPLEFMAALGVLRLVQRTNSNAALGFLSDGSFHPFIEGIEGVQLSTLVAEDAAAPLIDKAWWLRYEKQEKKGTKLVADLKAPPSVFRSFLRACVDSWSHGDPEAAAYAAAFGTDVAVDGKGNTKPTAFHFTAANQQFLDQVDSIRGWVTSEWASKSLLDGPDLRSGSNLRWDPAAERNWALMANNPVDSGTSVNAPLEWLAFSAMPLFPTFPRGSRICTTGVRQRSDKMEMIWPLWSTAASLETVRSIVGMNWTGLASERRVRGVFAVCSSAIRRTSQGFGNFSPASVST